MGTTQATRYDGTDIRDRLDRVRKDLAEVFYDILNHYTPAKDAKHVVETAEDIHFLCQRINEIVARQRSTSR